MGPMRSTSRRSALVAVVAVVAGAEGCGAASPADRRAALLTAAEAEAIAARWQGAWVMPFHVGDPAASRIGTREVWAVTGRQLTRWDGGAETTEPMTPIAPCLVKVGDRQFHYEAFAFADGQLVVDHEVGIRDGGAITVCNGLGHVYTFDGTTCRYWEKRFAGRELAPHPASCKVDGARFEATSPDDVTGPHAMRIEGQLVRRDVETPRAPATSFASLAAAKAALIE